MKNINPEDHYRCCFEMNGKRVNLFDPDYKSVVQKFLRKEIPISFLIHRKLPVADSNLPAKSWYSFEFDKILLFTAMNGVNAKLFASPYNTAATHMSSNREAISFAPCIINSMLYELYVTTNWFFLFTSPYLSFAEACIDVSEKLKENQRDEKYKIKILGYVDLL